jgi:hypothetical protein
MAKLARHTNERLTKNPTDRPIQQQVQQELRPFVLPKPRGGRREKTRKPNGPKRSANGRFGNIKALSLHLGQTENWIRRRVWEGVFSVIRMPGVQELIFDFPKIERELEAYSTTFVPSED